MKITQVREFEEKVCSYIREHQMLLPGERVAAGISGGADSVCLLFVLLEWKRRYGLEFAAVHVNHGIRREAKEDARFVEALCADHKVPFYLREADIPKLAAEQKCSEEEAGRNYRYEAFLEAAADFNAEKIAVAHNLNDRGETMLFHLFRGSGVRGLAGIPPVRDRIIRPLLCVERGEIEAYLEAIGQPFCRDATNDADDYTRNRIRHHILSYAEREIVSGCVQHMGQTAELLAETEDYLGQQTEEAIGQCVREESAQGEGNARSEGNARGEDNARSEGNIRGAGYRIDCAAFLRFHPAIQKRILYELTKRLSPGARDISRVHVADLQQLFMREGNRRICLPFGIRGRREYGRVILERVLSGERAEAVSASLPPGVRMDCKVLFVKDLPKNREKSLNFPQNQYTKWFDYDKMIKPPVLRTRAGGDYLMIRDDRGEMHHKKLKAYMVTEKIPADVRERIPVLAEDSHVLWLVGYRISEYYKVSENTKRVLQVQLITDCNSSGTEEKNGGTC